MNEYRKAFRLLNKRQRQAVEQIDGPVLVIAGPGTGKTQLLSTRVGYILENTDALPQNILALTFTEAGVDAMRQRLTKFLGQDAYDVNISTYHAFGSELIRRYPEYAGGYDFEPIDELGADSLLREILESAPYANPLKSAETYAHDLRSLISDAKRALVTPDDLEKVVKNNLAFIQAAAQPVGETMAGFTRMGKGSTVFFEKLRRQLEATNNRLAPPVASLKNIALEELDQALGEAAESAKTKPLTAWKNSWLEKDDAGKFILGGRQVNRKIEAAAGIYRKYQQAMAKRKLYDYDDMILRAIKALEEHADFKFTLAEQYQYIMLDEFQDTNAAQFRIVELLTDNPVNEGRPNLLAVGDDDQAIYAFQGAELTNMSRFAQIYRDVKVIPLTENYRSHARILRAAQAVGEQISQRLHNQFPGIQKTLSAAAKELPPAAAVVHHSFISDAAQYQWVADEAKRLVGEGMEANEIAILAPRHKYLAPLLPYLAAHKLPLRYEKRENVLDKPVTRMLEQMSALIIALSARDQNAIDATWPEVLSYDFWGLPTEKIWSISWQAAQSGGDWTGLLLNDEQTSSIALFFLRLKDLLGVTNLEQQLDLLMGVNGDDQETYSLPIRSPFFDFYFVGRDKDLAYMEMLSDLSVLRGRLRRWRREEIAPLGLGDFLRFSADHRAAAINVLNSSPHHEASDALNIMTAYQAKGREFKAVFLLAAQDEVWGGSSRTQTSTLGLPPNLKFIRYRGDSDDERLRLLYVALTRAKNRLYLTTYQKTLDGQARRPLKYLAGREGLFDEVNHQDDAPALETVESYWHRRHQLPLPPKLRDLLADKLTCYQMSPTHLNQFVDVIYNGPEAFFLNTILRFPKGQSPPAQFGTVMHDSLRWVHDINAQEGKMPSLKRVQAFFDDRLASRRLPQLDYKLLRERGHRALDVYLAQRGTDFRAADTFERSFKNEGVFSGPAHLAGKIDKLRFDKKNKTITVYDFKTGSGYDKWVRTNASLHKYRQQLMMYKLLIENSHTYAGWKVDKGVLEFIEPPIDEDKIYRLEMDFDDKELAELQRLIEAVWRRIQNLDFPDVSKYPKTMGGIRAFEQDLLG